MANKHDQVNRYQGIVVLPVTAKFQPGTTVEIKELREGPIDCMVRDPMAMTDPATGNAVGDAIFDAAGATIAFDATLVPHA